MLFWGSRIFTFLVASSALAACAWYLTERLQWREAFDHLLRTDFSRLIALIWAAQFAYILLRTWRWKLLLTHANAKATFLELYWITAILVSLANITPGQMGEALKIELLKRRGSVDRLPGLGAFALERILDVLCVAAMGAIGLVFGSGLSEHYPGFKTGSWILIALGLTSLYMLLRFNPGGRASHWLDQMRTGGGSPKVWIKIAILTICSWGFVGIGWQISLLEVGVDLSLAEILWLISLVTLGTILSLIPGGLGVAEVLTVVTLINMGVAPVAAQSGALIVRVYGLVIILFGLTHLILWLLYRRLCGQMRSSIKGNKYG